MDREADALAYARELGRNFPFLRPRGSASQAFAERVADELFGVDGEVPADRLAEGAALLDDGARAGLVGAYVARFPDVWETLCGDIGRARAESELIASAVRASVDELREPQPAIVELLEDPAVPDLPYHAVACVLAHDDVWSLDDALTAAAAAAPVERRREAWERAIADVAAARLEPVHLERIRRRRLAALALRRLPRRAADRAGLRTEACVGYVYSA